jgi:two-component system, NarL family, invasion response regulator UvrY
MIKLLLVDDDQLILEGIKGLLQNNHQFDVVGTVKSGEESLSFLETNKVDIVILDLSMPGLGGMETTKKISYKYPQTKIIILTVNKSETLPKQLINLGASAYLTKGCDLNELIKGITRVYRGQEYVSNELTQKLFFNSLNNQNDNPFDALTKREMTVIMSILDGTTLVKIAENLNLSPKTVSTHKARAFEKLNIKVNMALYLLAEEFNIAST